MSYRFRCYITAKASPGFWEEQLKNQEIRKLPFEINKLISDEIVIISENGTAFDDLMDLSREYPKEIFRVKIAPEEVCDNYVYLFEISKGDSKLINEGYEYCFGIDTNDLKKLPEGLYERFQKKVADYFQKLDYHPKKVKLHINFHKDHNEEDIAAQYSVIVEYKTKDVRLTAKKYGLTYIDVVVEFLDEKGIRKASEIESSFNYDELPF